MKKIYHLLILTVSLICKTLSAQVTEAQLEASVKAGIDPYFVESTDTVSKFGPNCIVRDLLQDKSGNYWLASWKGIIKYDGKVFTNYTLKYNLIHFHVFRVYEDKKGILWFSTVRGGLYRYDGKTFKLFTKREGLADNTVLCIAEDKTGKVWFGTEQGVSSFDGKKFTNFTTQEGLSDNYVNSILVDKKGNLWFGTGKGIDCYDMKSLTKFTDKDSSVFKRVASLFEDKAGNIWIGSGTKEFGSKAFCRYDGKLVHEIKQNFVMYMCQDQKGDLWFAHNEGNANFRFSLYKYEFSSGTSTKILEQNGDNPQIFGIMEDKEGNICFGTTRGICRLDVRNVNSPCLKRTCKHDLPLRESIQEHQRELNKVCNYFRE